MGQLFCKECIHQNKLDNSKSRSAAVIDGSSWSSGQNSSHSDTFTSAGSPYEGGGEYYRSSPGTTKQRRDRIKNKKSCIALHAEFRDRQERGILIAPPLVTERVMEYTDNVFTGQDLGVDKVENLYVDDETGDIMADVMGADVDVDEGGVLVPPPGESPSKDEMEVIEEMETIDEEEGDGSSGPSSAILLDIVNENNDHNINELMEEEEEEEEEEEPPTRLESFPKTPEEESFLDMALSDDDNFVFDGMSDQYRQHLKDSMERIVVPGNTLLIRKGDDPDYMYLILEGEVAVYIDPTEYVDDQCIDIGKHAPLDISVPISNGSNSGSSSNPTATNGGEFGIKREFKESYVLQLRKSLFQSAYNENNTATTTTHRRGGSSSSISSSTNFVGQFFSVIRQSIGGHDSNTSNLTGTLEESPTHMDTTDIVSEFDPSFINLKELRGLKHERDLGPYDVFGELSLIYNCARTATCITSTTCILYRVDGEIFRSILSSSNSDRVMKRCTESKSALQTLYNMGAVEELDENTLRALEQTLHPVTFEQEDLVITKGGAHDPMFFVMSGKLLAHDIGMGDSRKADIILGEGGHFGELNLLTGRRSIANVTVLTPKARLMCVSKKDYQKRRAALEPLMKKLWLRNALLTVPLISKSMLLPHEINSLVHKLEQISFSKGNVSFTGNMQSALYIVEEGKIQIAVTDGDGVVNTFDQYDHFGESSLFDDKYFERKSVQVRAVLPTECMMLSRSAIVDVIGKINRLGKPLLPVSRKLIKNMKISDLTLHRILGVGMFGRVWLVQHKKLSTVYALKVMDKQEIIEKKMTKGVTREKNVMSSVEHPFISNLVSTFQDNHSLFMLMDYVQGGELFGLIYNVSKKGYLSNDAAAFYGACLTEALSHLHSRSICHRDLKPENILINSAGYIVLVDFGFAKVVLDNTFTTCGSPEYMAPEILLGKGHSFSVDHWAVGVLLYEMLVGQTPFIHVGATRMTLFRRVCNSTFAFPNPKKHGIAVSESAKLLIRGLLNKSCTERLGSSLTLGDEEISTNDWFQGLLTEYRDAFLSQKVSPPWLPDVTDELDASYFGSHDDMEKEAFIKKKVLLDKQAQRLFEGF